MNKSMVTYILLYEIYYVGNLSPVTSSYTHIIGWEHVYGLSPLNNCTIIIKPSVCQPAAGARLIS